MSEHSRNDGYFGGSVEFKTGVIAFKLLDIDCTVLLLAIVKTHEIKSTMKSLKFNFLNIYIFRSYIYLIGE